jgi:hypothetical protein
VRKFLKTAVAAVLLGLGVSAANASPTAFQGLVDGAGYLSATADYSTDVTNGAELAGLVNAYSQGVVSTGGTIQTLMDDIVNGEGGIYYGDQAYGLLKANQSGFTTAGTGPVTVFTSVAGSFTQSETDWSTYTGYANHIAYSGGVVQPGGLYYLSYAVLAANILGDGQIGAGGNAELSNALASALGTYVAPGVETPGTIVTATEALAISLWALKSESYTGTLSGGGTFNGLTVGGTNTAIGELANRLQAQLDNGLLYTEDVSYGILALEAFYGRDGTALIVSLRQALAESVGSTGTTGEISLSFGDAVDYNVNPQYAGAALQALPEPTTLSVIGLGAMALLARRRRVL